MGQNFNLIVPNSNVAMTCGDGPVAGVSTTTDDNQFIHAGGEVVIEAKSHLRSASEGLWSGAGIGGVLMGTPATIQHSAGGGVQIYAGAGITPATGDAGGPADPFAASEPASFDAGSYADSMNAVNDFVKAAGDVAGGVVGFRGAESGLDRAKAAFEVAKGGWDAAKALGAKDKGADKAVGFTGTAFGVADMTVKAADGDYAGAAVAGLGAIGSTLGAANNDDNVKALTAANAARAAKADEAAQAGGPGAPNDGPRIYEVAPANIDRKVGQDMTSKVAGKKEDKVDGNIEMTSGASISAKAFNKVETSSMTFEAYANIGATMKGLASAKVESLGIVTIDGKTRVKVESGVKIAVSAPTIEVEGKASWTLDTPSCEIKSPDVKIGAGNVKIESKTEITEQLKVLGSIVGKKACHIDDQLQVKAGANIKKSLKVGGKIKNGSLQAS